MKVYFGAIIILFMIIHGCSSKKNENKIRTDSFYTNKGGLDLRRIPLIKPYELLNVNAFEWRMNLETVDLLTLSIHNVKGANVMDGKIIIYSEGGTEVKNKLYDKAWFIIDPLTVKEVAYFNLTDYQKAIKENALQDPPLYSPEIIYKQFDKSDHIEWK